MSTRENLLNVIKREYKRLKRIEKTQKNWQSKSI
jgi:hypothetical protein